MSRQERGELRDAAREIFRGLAASYEWILDAATLLQDRRWKSWVLESVGQGLNVKLLDLGCGTLLLEEYRRLSGFEVAGLDLSGEMLAVGRAKRLPNVFLLVEGDAVALPFRDESFDSVVSCYVVKYVDVHSFLKELSRVVRPGGAVVFYDFARPKGPLAPFLGVYVYGVLRIVGVLLQAGRRRESPTFERLPGIIRTATWDSGLIDLMKNCGFDGIKVKKFASGIMRAYAATKG